MRIDSVQSDRAMRPLGKFLFKCEFSNKLGARPVSSEILNDAMLQKLMYSVIEVNIPKLEAEATDDLSYGSFSISFPFFSTEKKEMRMEFYETDNMEIFKLFSYLLSKNRWKASTMFRWDQAELYVTITIYDHRNLFGYGYRALFSESYALKTAKVVSPEFSRTNDVSLLKTEVTFNTVQNRNYDRGDLTSIDAGNEFRNNDRSADTAFTSTEELGNTIAKYFEEKFKSENGDLPENASATEKYSTDRVSSDVELRSFADSLGRNSRSRTAALDDKTKRDELRRLLKNKGVDVNDYSEVSDALVDMGIFGQTSNNYCQRGVSVLEAIVTGNDRVLAPTASSSIKAWESAGFKETDSRKLNSVKDINKYLSEEAAKGNLSEGDKIVIDYDSSDREAGHALTVLYNDKNGWYVSSDTRHHTMSGLGQNHKVDEVHILRMTETERNRRSALIDGSDETTADINARLSMTQEQKKLSEINEGYAKLMKGK